MTTFIRLESSVVPRRRCPALSRLLLLPKRCPHLVVVPLHDVEVGGVLEVVDAGGENLNEGLVVRDQRVQELLEGYLRQHFLILSDVFNERVCDLLFNDLCGLLCQKLRLFHRPLSDKLYRKTHQSEYSEGLGMFLKQTGSLMLPLVFTHL